MYLVQLDLSSSMSVEELKRILLSLIADYNEFASDDEQIEMIGDPVVNSY